MRNIRKLSLWGFIFLMSIFSTLIINNNSAFAALTSSTDLAVLKDAPTGLAVSSYMSNAKPVSPDGITGYPYTTNSAQIVDHSGSNTPDGNVISLANGNGTYGSIWSTDQTFDINKPQTISAWLYFGSGEGSEDVNSEGIAFVLQNDKRGVAALGAGLDGMGVYGFDNSTMLVFNSYAKNISYVAGSAIQNSVALEFDTARNNFFGDNNKPIGLSSLGIPLLGDLYSQNGFDTSLGSKPSSSIGIPGNLTYGTGGGFGSIAVTYPSFAGTYYQLPISDMKGASTRYPGFDNGTVMVHSNPTAANLINENKPSGDPVYWHHVTIDWTPADGSNMAKLTYTYNDISEEGLENTSSKKKIVTNDIDTSKLNTTSGKVRWGFTGANGNTDSAATKLVALDSTPESPYSDASASITDKTLNKTISNDATDNTVADGDKLSLDYNLSYIRGDDPIQAIAAKIKIPDNVTVTPDANGNIATITYADGKDPVQISSDDLIDESLQYTLAKDLSDTNSSAKISIAATANNDTSSDINVKQAAASFTGSNSIALTSSPAFTILAKKDYSLNLSTNSSTDYNLLYKNDNSTWNSDLNLNYSDNAPSDLASSDIIFNIEVGGHTYTSAQDIDLKGGFPASTNIDFLKVIEGSGDDIWDIFPLNSTKEVKVTAVDRTNGMVSNTLTYNVTVQPNKSLALKVSDNLAFQDIHFGNRSTYLKRKSDFDLSVTSLREPWQLSVTSNGLYDSNNDLNGNMTLVYRQNDTSDYSPISSTPLVVETNNNSYTTSTTDNISEDWEPDTGLLLKQLEISPAGTYTGTLKWTIADVISNN
ncbi:hypothetical protein [Companilactobacillus baiquanensis]|uniref:Cell surface protein n=1 Tax=Companilactobacillus baiquanensis TaxID=2486005 RepID=A0ABW1USH9_9LACO|nr:hypothetical protein [Companilactobacillus baiquanensis]